MLRKKSEGMRNKVKCYGLYMWLKVVRRSYELHSPCAKIVPCFVGLYFGVRLSSEKEAAVKDPTVIYIRSLILSEVDDSGWSLKQ
jgi:hypothetical protein